MGDILERRQNAPLVGTTLPPEAVSLRRPKSSSMHITLCLPEAVPLSKTNQRGRDNLGEASRRILSASRQVLHQCILPVIT